MLITERYVDLAANYIGCPYVWQGKGNEIWTPTGPVKNTFGVTPLVFDCSGFVTYVLALIIKDMDLRFTHSAKTILDTFPITQAAECGTLLLYPGHVAIDMGRGFVLDAAGGDETTTTPIAAKARGAKVMLHYNTRNPGSLLGMRRIPLDKSELRTI